MSLYIGLISGSSADALDAALVEFRGDLPRLRAVHSHAFPAEFRHQVLALSQSALTLSLSEIAALDVECARQFAAAALELLEKAGMEPGAITALGSHGQTLLHAPHQEPPRTWQIGDPNTLAQLTGITTVADFRRRDLAVGGQGAPLVPIFHRALFQNREETRVVLNLGGIANITVLPADGGPVLGFDTGPANCLLDAWISRYRQQPLDREGAWALSGQVDRSLLDQLLSDAYFQRPPPKSTGRDYFNLDWLQARLPADYSPVNIQATLLRLTVESVAGEVEKFSPHRLLVCGGGAHNTALMEALRARLQPCLVESTEAHGMSPDWVEAACFAWLARQTLAGRPGNLPSVTGARRAVVLGGIYPASNEP